MTIIVTGACRITSNGIEQRMAELMPRLRPIRPVTELEQTALVAAAGAFEAAGIPFPSGSAEIGIYVGIDDAVEDIKDDYFGAVAQEGLLGASPLLFPYTAPNAPAAQIAIALDIRGESITVALNDSPGDVLQYAAECIRGRHTGRAVAGLITLQDAAASAAAGRYRAEFFVLEEEGKAMTRGATLRKQGGIE